MIKSKIYLVSVILITLLLTGYSEKKPKILIIGDSISIGYTPFVKEHFGDRAMISHNPGNAQHTGTGLEKITEWIGAEQWDIIQFNWGLWDLCYRHPDSKVQGNRDKVNGQLTYSVVDYTANLDSIVSTLKKKTKAKLIFVTTSYVPENEAGRFKSDAIKYNNAAKSIMKKHSIIVNDIYEQSKQIHKEFGKGSDNVHYTKEGYQKLGKLVTDFLETEIN
ncbi:SGNH/GDSL hydrolase family protein [Aureibaculum conchae]|uniref:SGNH/GDSL hydrolase family protein n=1 Tax=Aureibaculum sp. 2308TA14-22 TaxID=3108392 RepID=UPI00339223D9